MTSLNVTLLKHGSTLPDMLGAAVLLPVLDAHLDVIQRPGEKPAQAYWVNTGLAFDVPEGHILKIYPAPAIAQLHLARLAECVAVVLPGDRREVALRMVVDGGGKAFEPKQGMVVAHAFLETMITPKLVAVAGADQASPEADKTFVPASEIDVPASENVEATKDTPRSKKAK